MVAQPLVSVRVGVLGEHVVDGPREVGVDQVEQLEPVVHRVAAPERGLLREVRRDDQAGGVVQVLRGVVVPLPRCQDLAGHGGHRLVVAQDAALELPGPFHGTLQHGLVRVGERLLQRGPQPVGSRDAGDANR